MKKTVNVVGAIIQNENKDILCALRSPEMSLPNYWEFPGGKIEQDEAPEEALKREIQEELGCEIEVFNKVENTTYEYNKIIVQLHTYKSKIAIGIPKAKEHAELKWVPTSLLHELEWAPADIPAVDKLLSDEINK